MILKLWFSEKFSGTSPKDLNIDNPENRDETYGKMAVLRNPVKG
jgi:hypothetical protein